MSDGDWSNNFGTSRNPHIVTNDWFPVSIGLTIIVPYGYLLVNPAILTDTFSRNNGGKSMLNDQSFSNLSTGNVDVERGQLGQVA